MRQKRICAVLAALMTAASLLTACAGKDSSAADGTASTADTAQTTESTDAASDETGTAAVTGETGTDGSQNKAPDTEPSGTAKTEAGTGSSGKTGTEPAASGITEFASVPQSGTGKEAYDALIRFLDACKAGDAGRIIDSANLAAAVGIPDVPDLTEAAKQMKIESYSVGRCAENKVVLEQYREYRAEALESVAKMEAEQKKQFEQYLEFMPEIDGVWVFETETDPPLSSKSSPTLMYVIHTNGTWKVDLSVVSAMNGYVGKSKITSANSAAKSVYLAFMSALTDADAEETVDIRKLDGQYSFKGSDFEGLTDPKSVTDRKTLLEQVKYSVSKYFPEITKLTALEIVIKDGSVSAIAVAKGEMTDGLTGRTTLVYGTYPNRMTKEKLEEHPTIGQALKYAAAD